MSDAPVQHSTSLRYLLRDLTRNPQFRELQAIAQNELSVGIRPVAALATWLCKFQPELVHESSLNIAIIGAEQEDTVDEGRWYGLLGHLAGNDRLHVRTTFVGPSLYVFSGVDPVPDGIWKTSGARVLAQLGHDKATTHRTDVGAFSRTPQAADIDLFVLFNPGFEDDERYSWFEPGQLDALCALGKPIAVTAYAEEEQLQEAFLMKAWGFTPLDDVISNPFIGVDTPAGAWARQLWAIKPGALPENREADQRLLHQNRRYMLVAEKVMFQTGAPIPSGTGKLITLKVAGSEADDTRAVQLPAGEDDAPLAVGVSSGTLYRLEKRGAVALPDMVQHRLPQEILKTYDVQARFSFEHILWALDATDWFGRRANDDEMAEEIEGVRNFGGLDFAEVHEQMESLRQDKAMMADPHLREITEALGGMTQMLDMLPPEMKEMLEKGSGAWPTRTAFEPTKGAAAFFHALETANWVHASDLLREAPNLGRALDRNGANAAMYAASSNNVEFLEELAQTGTDFGIQDIELFSPLHEAARRGYPEVARFLLAHGATPNAITRHGWSALLMALAGRMGNTPASAFSQIVEDLLSYGVDLRHRNAAGMDAASLVDAVELTDAARKALKKALATGASK